jgi:hypothetical protein
VPLNAIVRSLATARHILIAIPLKDTDLSIPAPLREVDFLKTFLILMFCSVIGGAIAGGILGALVGLIAPALDASIDTVRILVAIISGFSGLAIMYFFFRLLVLRLIVRRLIAADIGDRAHAI